MSKYTPGPWKRQDWAVLCKNDTVVCNVLPWDTSGCREEDHTNAHLIAAAPELYEALEAVVAWAGQVAGDCEDDTQAYLEEESIRRAEHALAKARGDGS